MDRIHIACGQLTWKNVAETQVLSEIAQAGYDGAGAGPRTDRTTQDTIALFAKYGLKTAPGYLSADFWRKEQEADILDKARKYAAFNREAGLTELYVAAGGFTTYTTRRGLTRYQIAGQVQPQDSMTDAEWRQFVSTINKVGEITLAAGVRSCFHNHVGSTIESRAEIDRLFATADRRLLFQGPDTGHLAWAGIDVVAFLQDYAKDILTLHIKDINAAVLKEGVASRWEYKDFSDHGLFVEIGHGMIDYPAAFNVLRNAGFKGWVIVETDVTTQPTPLQSAIMSRQFLRTLGL